MSPPRRYRPAIGFALLAGAAALLLWWQTPHGLGLEGDSADYVSMARQLADNRLPRFDAAGDRRLPMTQFPPGYPLVLSLGPRVGIDLLDFARVLHAALLAATVWLVGALALRHTRSPPVALAAAAYVAVSPQVQLAFASLMSEALFVPLVLLGAFLSASRVATRPRPVVRPAGSDLSASLKSRTGLGRVATRLAEGGGAVFVLASSVLCRYAGGFFVVGVFAVPLASGRPRRAGRAAKALALLALALAPAVAWSLWLRRLGAEPSRIVRWHAPDAATLRRALSAVGGWLLPVPVGGGGVLTAVAGAAVMLALLWTVGRRLKRPRRATGGPGLWAALLLVYAVGLWFSRLFLDEAMPMGARLWLPALPLAVLLAADAARRFARSGRVARIVLAFAVGALLAFATASTLRQAAALRRDGIGYASPRWTSSPTLDFVRSLPPGAPVASNAADAIALLLGRDATPLPQTVFRTSGNDNVRWRDQLRAQGKRLRAAGGVVVFFDSVDRRDFLVRERQLRDVLKLEPAAILEDGRAYRVTGIR